MKTKTKNESCETEKKITPTHIGFIMDGNRRWAKSRNLPSLEGHRQGKNALFNLLDPAIERGIKYITVYAFSTENWGRAEEEVKYLFNLFEIMLEAETEKMVKKGVKLNTIGQIERLPERLQKLIKKSEERTKNCDTLIFNIAFSYGGRAEIVEATKNIIKDGIDPSELTEEKFSEYIYTKGQPDPDLIVRTSGEQRTSGFLLWQSAYSELYFTQTVWPDFDGSELDRVIDEYNARERRFGK